MDGYTLDLSVFESTLPRAVKAGHVSQRDADIVLEGIRNGFDLFVDPDKLQGLRYHKNYKSAYENKATVTEALLKRVKDGKTLKLGAWSGDVASLPTSDGCVVPQGAVPKKLEPDKIRPVSDHTKTLFNSAVDLNKVRHTLNTYEEISEALMPGYYMRVEDVDGAFPILPLSPRVWKYMYVHWYDVDKPLEEQQAPNTLYVHVFGDFGTSTLPGIWDLFVKCLKGMAMVEHILTLPMPHYVDDNGLIGPDKDEVDNEAEALGAYFASLGVPFKRLKSLVAATRQLMLGFWWDSLSRTRSLEVKKYNIYLEHLESVLEAKTLTLHEMQVLAGRMHRASLTLPMRSKVYMSGILLMQHGLKLPWHRRRVTAELRKDILSLIKILKCNHGEGLFDYSHLPLAPPIYTDASRSSSYSGGGYFTLDGAYDYWKYARSMSRQPIMILEADAAYRALATLAPTLKGKRVALYTDNQSFGFALERGASTSPALNTVLKRIFELSVEWSFVVQPFWIPTDDNYLADALSRNELSKFLYAAADFHFRHSFCLRRSCISSGHHANPAEQIQAVEHKHAEDGDETFRGLCSSS